jgi:hypothetical protein
MHGHDTGILKDIYPAFGHAFARHFQSLTAYQFIDLKMVMFIRL